ncbi:hypothetical protein ACQKNC_11260 [Lysinibacillus sp. NPDC094177]|uniref:hypothetical protein n=1 Tax=Lysinibacillus sp. NPDC094177 TaxID=3390580 RepID=UPI003CFFB4B1
MNIFDTQTLTDTLTVISKSYVMNELTDTPSTVEGFVTNSELNDESKFHFHSLSQFKRGDYISIDGSYYLVTGDVIAHRGFKYKSVVEYCNGFFELTEEQRIKVGTDAVGRPIYKTEIVVIGQSPIIATYRDMKLTEDSITTASKNLIITMQDNLSNRTNFQVNATVSLFGRSYKVIDSEVAKVGLLQLRVTTEDVMLPVK